MADHSKPTVTSTYANYTSELDGRLDDLALGLDPATTSPTNVPTNAIRWASASNKWQKWNGSSWVDLSGSYSININGTVGATTPAAGSFTNASYTGTLTGGTGVVDIGSGQVYKDASGNVGINTSSPTSLLTLNKASNTTVLDLTFTGPAVANNYQELKFRVSGSDVIRTGIRSIQAANGSFGASLAFLTENLAGAYSERLRISSEGNVGIGNTNPAVPLDVKSNASAAAVTIRARGSNDYSFIIFRQSDGTEDLGGIANLRTAANTGNLLFYTAGGSAATERARIDSSGNLLVGTTSGGGSRLATSANGSTASNYNIYDTATGATIYACVNFIRNGSAVGYIGTSSTATNYSTSSDYRLKEEWVAVADASTRVNALKPVNFAWKVDGSRVDGFLAHELAEVVPEAVTGEKDAVDAEGKPVYQGVDPSKLVPLLTAALQEALAKIESLEARLDAANL